MKFFLTPFILMFLFGCKTYKAINRNDIKAVFILFKGRADRHGYQLYDNSVVKFDIRHSYAKIALDKYKNKLELLRKLPSNYLDNFIINKKIIKPAPVKVLPLNEFGYIQTHSGELIFYGRSKSVFVDLTNNRVYFGESTIKVK